MGADIDIVESFRTDMTCAVRLRRPLLECEVTEWADKFAAEIGRLRGEVDSLRGWFDASRAPSNMSDDHDDAAGDDADDIAPAEAKDPAPAMPNGVEEMVAYLDNWLSREHGLNLGRVKVGGAVDAALRAADNRDAAGVDRSGITPVFRVCTAYEAGVGKGIQGRDVGNPYKPNTDEHEAWGYGFKQGRSVDEDEAELEFRPGDPDSPMPSQRAPAPVQAAPQEGEVLPRELAQWMRDRGILPDEPFTDADLIAALNNHEVELLAAHPSACELGAVRDAVGPLNLAADNDGKLQLYRAGFNLRFATFSPGVLESERRAVFAALQHRGDSKEVDRG